MTEEYCNRIEDEPSYEEIKDFMHWMYQRHMHTLYISEQEFLFSSFLYAYLNQDVSGIDEAISDFKKIDSEIGKKNLIEGIDDFINLPYSSKAKGYYVEEATGGHISKYNWLEDLEYIKNELYK